MECSGFKENMEQLRFRGKRVYGIIEEFLLRCWNISCEVESGKRKVWKVKQILN